MSSRQILIVCRKIGAPFLLGAAALAAGQPAHLPVKPPPVIEENVGQAGPGVDYALRSGGASIRLSPASIDVRAPGNSVSIRMEGASPGARPSGEEPCGVVRAYVAGKGRSGQSFRRVRYRSIYPGVDLIYRFNERDEFEFDFAVAPGADPSLIRMRIGSTSSWRLDSEGSIAFDRPASIHLRAPAVFQHQAGRRVPVRGGYRRENDTITFALGAYARERELIIDPTLTFSLLLGGSYADSAYAVTADWTGTTVTAGDTTSTDFPVSNASRLPLSRNRTAFVSKINSAGTAVVFSTYFGGSGGDSARAVAQDPAGNIYVAGVTTSADFTATLPAPESTATAQQKTFVAKFRPDGTLAYSRLVNGSAETVPTAIAADSSGGTYVAGYTTSTNFPTTAGAMQRTYGGGARDAIVFKLSADGTTLMYSTFFGGSGDEQATGIALDSSLNAYITGQTDSTNLPIRNAAQPFPGGGTDGFVLKLNANGTSPVYATYLGGSSWEQGYAIAVDGTGKAWIAGTTSSYDFPFLTGSPRPLFAGNYDVFVASVSADGSSVISTLFGGSKDDFAAGIALDAGGRVWVGGTTNSPNFPLVSPITTVGIRLAHGFIARYDSALSTMQFSTLIGGSNSETVRSIAAVGTDVIVAGTTTSTDFFVTPGSLTHASIGASDAFLVRISSPLAGAPTATFVKSDKTTQGNWRAVYGAEGYNVIGDNYLNPSYVTPAAANNTYYAFQASTTDVRALQRATNPSTRIPACWYTSNSMYLDLNFTDQATHQFALYTLDFDLLNRPMRVDILDSYSNILDTRITTGQANGEYLVWNLSGHVTVKMTVAGPSNAVISGYFFGGPLAPPTYTGTAAFVKSDKTTQGNWQASYGSDGYTVLGDSYKTPSYVSPVPGNTAYYLFQATTTDVRALKKATDPSTRVPACWYTSNSMTLDLNFSDSAAHQIALYSLDFDYQNRPMRVDVMDATGYLLDSRTTTAQATGEYLVWNLSGHVILRMSVAGPSNAVISGFFFGSALTPPVYTGAAAFVKSDKTTQGNWNTAYGSEGYNVIGDQSKNPAYVTPLPANNTYYAFLPSTTDVRALKEVSNPALRIPACWYSSNSMTLDLNFTDALTHQFALYSLDFDLLNRPMKVDIVDSSGNFLDTRTTTAQATGEYLVWNLSGHVVVRMTVAGPSNIVLSGYFFGGP